MISGKTYTVHIGSNLDILPTLPDNSVDAIVTDPPYGLSDNKFVAETITRWIQGERDFIPDGKGFMGKSWDAFVPPPAVWDECLRVLKPGGHLLAFFGSRTQDIGALSIRLAEFEIRDSIAWMYGSGFPKSLDISKAIDKAAGAEREKIPATGGLHKNANLNDDGWSKIGDEQATMDSKEAITPEAQQWEGWGTALKPAFEPIIVARKPLIGTVAENVLTYGTGGLNIDGSRVGTGEDRADGGQSGTSAIWGQKNNPVERPTGGRWPANVILDEYTAELLDEQSGVSKSGAAGKKASSGFPGGGYDGEYTIPYGDTGGASRFFYVAKASKRDRNEGLEELEETSAGEMVSREEGSAGMNSPRAGAGRTSGAKNFHPTVKPTDLMRYLVKLVTPTGGTVLDPFTGSGSTGKAAILEGFEFIGIEMTEDYIPIIEGRLAHAEATLQEQKDKQGEALF